MVEIRSRDTVLADLRTVYDDSQEPNWDGYNAAPASAASYAIARQLLEHLPASIPDPEVDIAPNGKVMFDWHQAPRQAITLTIGGDGELAFAALVGTRKFSGTDVVVDTLPHVLLVEISNLYR